MMSRKFLPDDLERIIRRRLEELARGLVQDVSGIVEEALETFKPIARRMIIQEYIAPDYDVYVKGDRVVALIQLPGAEKESIDLRITERMLMLEAAFSKNLIEKAPEARLFKSKGYRCSIELPEEVDPAGGTASYQDGILLVQLPVKKLRGVKVKIE